MNERILNVRPCPCPLPLHLPLLPCPFPLTLPLPLPLPLLPCPFPLHSRAGRALVGCAASRAVCALGGLRWRVVRGIGP